MFAGYVSLGDTIICPVVARNGSSVPLNATALPTYRIYEGSVLMTGGTGSLAFKDTGTITNATNASPIVITSTGHGLTTGTKVTITGVGGNDAANTTATITYVDADTFSLDGTTGDGAYTSGGTWNVSGLYNVSVTPTGGNGYAAGGFYDIVVVYAISGTTYCETLRFGVI